MLDFMKWVLIFCFPAKFPKLFARHEYLQFPILKLFRNCFYLCTVKIGLGGIKIFQLKDQLWV